MAQKIVERQWKMIGFETKFWTLIFPDSLEGEEIQFQSHKDSEIEYFRKPKKTTSKDFVVIIDIMSKFTYLWRFEAYLIKLLHLVDFSCWGPKVRFLGYLRAILGQTLETRSPLHYNLKLKISALHFKLLCGEILRQWQVLFLRRFLGSQQNLKFWRNQNIE